MDVTALNNIALSQISPSTSPSDISVAILGKQLDVTQKLGDTMIQAMERSVNPHIGGNIDISVYYRIKKQESAFTQLLLFVLESFYFRIFYFKFFILLKKSQ